MIRAYGKYLLILGGATVAWLAGFATYHAMVLLPVIERFR